jgi:hypothetical protein
MCSAATAACLLSVLRLRAKCATRHVAGGLARSLDLARGFRGLGGGMVRAAGIVKHARGHDVLARRRARSQHAMPHDAMAAASIRILAKVRDRAVLQDRQPFVGDRGPQAVAHPLLALLAIERANVHAGFDAEPERTESSLLDAVRVGPRGRRPQCIPRPNAHGSLRSSCHRIVAGSKAPASSFPRCPRPASAPGRSDRRRERRA